MKIASVGIGLMVLGALAALYALFAFGTTFSSDILHLAVAHDPALLHKQGMIFQAGLVAFLSGSILLAAAVLADGLHEGIERKE